MRLMPGHPGWIGDRPARMLMIAAAAAMGWACPAPADGPGPGEAPGELVVGMSTALTGPSQNLGQQMRQGVELALAEANAAGGIRGRLVRLEALDDGYEPSRAAPNMRKLIADERVLAVVGNVGTPTAVVSLPIAREGGMPFVGAFSGAGLLRATPPERYVINFRASYAEELGAMVDALIDRAGLRPGEVGFFTQRDAFGDCVFEDGLAALRRRGLPEGKGPAHGRFERNTEAVEGALADLIAAETPVRAVIMVGTYAPCAKLVRLAREHGLEMRFLGLSFIGVTSFSREAGDSGEGVIVTQVVPHYEADLPGTRAYRAALAAAGATEPAFGSLEGYMVGRMLLKGLEGCAGRPSREGLASALAGLGSFDLGLGVPLRLSEEEHQACHAVWPTVIRGGRVVPMDWDELSPAGERGVRTAAVESAGAAR